MPHSKHDYQDLDGKILSISLEDSMAACDLGFQKYRDPPMQTS